MINESDDLQLVVAVFGSVGRNFSANLFWGCWKFVDESRWDEQPEENDPPGDSKWPFDSLVGGHLTFERVT